VFGYGSLVADLDPVPTRAFSTAGFIAELRDYRRGWGVAMDNREDIPGYKYYLDEHGDRPDLHVAFLDIGPALGDAVNGVCAPLARDQLAGLDERERNYVRVDVTAQLDLPEPDIRVWAYVGSDEGRSRFTTARSAGRAVIHEDYLQAVIGAFKALGPAHYQACAPSLDPEELPVKSLARRDLR
jgi:hypothetical protein